MVITSKCGEGLECESVRRGLAWLVAKQVDDWTRVAPTLILEDIQVLNVCCCHVLSDEAVSCTDVVDYYVFHVI